MLRIALQAGKRYLARKSMFFYTYVLRGKKDSELYVGWSKNLEQRIKQHINGEVDAAKYRLPIELIYYEACKSEEAAIKREKALKSGFGRAYLNRRLK